MYRGQVEYRIDPSAYHPDRQAAIAAIAAMPYPKMALRRLVSFARHEATSNVYVGLEHVNSGTGELNGTGCADEMAGGLGFQTGNVLFPKLRPYLNKVWLAEFNGGCSTEFYVLQATEQVLPKFLALILRSDFITRQTSRLMTGTTLPRLQTTDVHRLVLPVPPLGAQKKLIAVYETAFNAFVLANKQANQKLAGIDEYLLAELGITLPPEPENTLASRIFTAQRRELAGWRFDPYYFGAKFHALEHGLDHGSYPTASLAQLCLSINNGADCREFITDGLPYAKVAEVKPFAVDLAQAQTVPADSIPERGLVQKGDLLLTRKGTFGVAALVETDAKFAISSEVFRIELDSSKVLGSYLATVLNSSICQEQFDRQKIGMIMGSLTQVSLRRIRLPLPPIDKQREIQTYASQIRQSAASLIAEAKTELEAAKRRIEAMLLGDPA